MDETNVLEAGRAAGPAFDLLKSKLRRPRPRPGTVYRSSLIKKLAQEDSRLVVSVTAPGGYGKTTLLSQWAERDDRAFAWVSVDEGDNDPKVLLTYVAEALDAIEPVGGRVFAALASPGSSVPGSVVPRLGSALAAMTAPVVLVLDDVHLLRNRQCQAALSVLADHVADGSRLVLAGRAEPPVRVARLRAEGRILEIGRADLSLTREEAASLLRGAEVALGEGDVAELHRRTEGWAAGLRWLDDRGGTEEQPVVGVWASILAMELGYPAEAERRADTIDRWQYGDATRPRDPRVEAWAALARAQLCRRGVAQIRADADEAARKFAAAGTVIPAAAGLQGLARDKEGCP